MRAGKEIKFVLCGRKGDNDYGSEWLRMRLFFSTHSGSSNTQTIAESKQEHIVTMADKIIIIIINCTLFLTVYSNIKTLTEAPIHTSMNINDNIKSR